MTTETSLVTIGLPVFNARDTVARCVESVLAQSYEHLELVISDNASDDGTSDILQVYADRDARVRLVRNPTNVGQRVNMNAVANLSRGRYFRWISADDWLEAEYLDSVLRELGSRPDAIGATSYFVLHGDDGSTRSRRYAGEFPDSIDPVRRFSRMLWFFHAGDSLYDPIYGLYRRDAFFRTSLLQVSEQNDWLITAELALIGPIVNVNQTLVHRARVYSKEINKPYMRKRMFPESPDAGRSSIFRLHDDLTAIVDRTHLSKAEKQKCARIVWKFCAEDLVRRTRGPTFQAIWKLLRRVGIERKR